LTREISFRHRHKPIRIRLADDGALELYVDDCLRKRRARGSREPQYVWTNVELEWEEHHYVEARYWAKDDLLRVTINREPLFELPLAGGDPVELR